MQFDDQNVDVSGVDDRRGGRRVGRGTAVAGGGGIIGLITVILVVLLGGGSGLAPGAVDVTGLPTGALDGGASGETLEELSTRCNAEGAIDEYADCFLIKVYNETDEVWAAELARRGEEYRRPALTFFEGQVSTACGPATSQVGPFYCPGDEHIYLDIGFLQQLQAQLGAEGRYAQAYILAHEFGHHLQTVLGVERQVRRAQQANPRQANALSVRMELQADCLAGVWGRLADDAGNVTISSGEVAEAQEAAAAVGDDRIQSSAGQRVDPERWTHGSAADRQAWYTTGYSSGDLNRCDTFAG
jgi:hypothetical protein